MSSVTVTPTGAANYGNISGDNYQYLQGELRRLSGVILDDKKEYLVTARLMPVARLGGYEGLDQMVSALRNTANSALRQDVVDALTTNETLFFRDALPWQALRSHIIPELMQEATSRRSLRFWSAASSSGQEAYSLVMLTNDMGLGNWNIDVLGTDISDHMVKRAREGIFSQIEVNRGLPISHLMKYFTRMGMEWKISDDLRRLTRFQRTDLRSPSNVVGPFDFVFCRNVLIYFDVATKVEILAHLRKLLRPGGYLILGGAESTLGLSNSFERVSAGSTIFYKAVK